MPGFSHYAKLRRLLDSEPPGWYIVRIDEPTSATNFRGEKPILIIITDCTQPMTTDPLRQISAT